MSGEVKITIGRKLTNGETLSYDVIQEILDSITAAVIDGTLTAREIADGSIPESKLSAAVRSQLAIPDGTITTAKLADGCLSADATGRAKMADGFITTAKIGDAQVTAAKLEASLVWPAGMIVEYGGETVPTGWFECNGAAVNRTTYAALFTAIGTLWGAGNGSTTFNIPDMRGYFARGWDHGAGNDPDAATRTGGDHVGSVQTDAVKAHLHGVSGALAQSGTGGGWAYSASGSPGNYTNSTGGNETRPANKNTMFIIKH